MMLGYVLLLSAFVLPFCAGYAASRCWSKKDKEKTEKSAFRAGYLTAIETWVETELPIEALQQSLSESYFVWKNKKEFPKGSYLH